MLQSVITLLQTDMTDNKYNEKKCLYSLRRDPLNECCKIYCQTKVKTYFITGGLNKGIMSSVL
jgi:hypothetical protein